VSLDSLLIVAGLVIIATFTPNFSGDGLARYQAVRAFASHGEFTRMVYSFWGPLFSTPLWYLGRLIKTPDWMLARYNLLLFSLFLLALWFLLKDTLDRDALRKFLLLLVAASMFPAHTLTFYGEVFTAVLVGAGIMAIAISQSSLGWPAMVLGVVNTPASVIGLFLVTVKRVFDSRHFRYLLAVVVALILMIVDIWVRRGEFLFNAYGADRGARTMLPYSGRPGFSYPIFFGVLSILLSFGKGLLFYTPGVLIPIRRTLQTINTRLWNGYLLWLLFGVGLVLTYSRWWAWYGGFYWGPRFFLFVSIPASFALALRLRYPPVTLLGRLALAAVLALSLWVAVVGIVYGQSNLDICTQNGYALEHLCWYVPEFSALWHPFIEASTLDLRDLLFMLFALCVFLRMTLPMLLGSQSPLWSALSTVRSHYLGFRSWRF
jgi:hypothetical protein